MVREVIEVEDYAIAYLKYRRWDDFSTINLYRLLQESYLQSYEREATLAIL